MPERHDLATSDYFRQLRMKLDEARHGDRGRLLRAACDFLQVSQAQVYRELQRVGWSSGRKTRSDRGSTALEEREADEVATILVQSTRANGKRLASVETAYGIAVANGLVKPGLSRQAVINGLRARGLHPEQLTRPAPHTEQRTLHPNHLWQIDASVCVLYYLKDTGLAVAREKVFYKNKPANLAKIANQRVLRYLVVDHYSGAFWLEYRLGSEDTENLFTTFLHAIQKRPHAQDPMHGVPLALMMDAGSANTSHMFVEFLKTMDVRAMTHMPGNPRAKGSVESHMNIVEREFESRLAFMKVRDLAHLNEVAQEWSRTFQATRQHTRHGHSRFGLWQTIREHELRIAPDADLCRELLTSKPQRCKVRGGLTVRYTVPKLGAHEYLVEHVPGVSVGDELLVCVNPYTAPEAVALVTDRDGTEIRYALTPIKRDAAGFATHAPVIGEAYRAPADTRADTNRKRLLKNAFGTETLRDAEAAQDRGAVAMRGRLDPMADIERARNDVLGYMPRRGTDLPITAPRTEVKPLTHAQAAKRLRDAGVEMNRERYAQLVEAYPDGVAEEALVALKARWVAAAAPAVEQSASTPMRRVK